jgi:hypothetical protein
MQYCSISICCVIALAKLMRRSTAASFSRSPVRDRNHTEKLDGMLGYCIGPRGTEPKLKLKIEALPGLPGETLPCPNSSNALFSVRRFCPRRWRSAHLADAGRCG